ncbi:hypothetical protein GCM10009675_15980 [Prauserella alba]|uniref:Uncharacterized protein n=1 Tax=Prauserella alba TaxID=176898 RepID=A0ABN1VBA8_9PSEU
MPTGATPAGSFDSARLRPLKTPRRPAPALPGSRNTTPGIRNTSPGGRNTGSGIRNTAWAACDMKKETPVRLLR